MHEFGGDIGTLLRDLVEFLECLGEVELPEAQQSARESLLVRSRTALQRGSESVEPYLDMSIGKSMLVLSADETDQPQEYVNADDQQAQRGSLQHYYETFQDFQGDGTKGGKKDGKNDNDKEVDDVILLYASFSAAQAKSKSVKSGPLLYLKRERRMFAPFNVFWLNRQCWVSLVGSHLLLYGNERESRPYLVAPLRGYKSRAAPGALARDPRRSEAAFEIYCPGERTFQFVANNVQEMREWVQAVSENLDPEVKKTRAATFVEILDLESTERMCIERVKEEKEKYQDVFPKPKSKNKEKQLNNKADATFDKETVEETKEDVPPLPARTRRLPSLPSQERISYEPREEIYDEEGLYHRIEDIRAQREYQNCQVRDGTRTVKATNPDVATVDLIQETYDDMEVFADKLKSATDEPLETYDDVQSVGVQDKIKDIASTVAPISYNDVQSAVSDNSRVKSGKNLKPSQKRSFLDRVRNRKESLVKKEEKKPKSPTSTVVPSTRIGAEDDQVNGHEAELPCYDEVSSLTIGRESNPQVDDEEYLSPPPPRPIYSRPPTIVKCALPDEIYDDIGCKGCANLADVVKDYPKNGSFLSDLQLGIDKEHYQVPKSGNRKVVEQQQPEELYDDVTLSESFKNRQREAAPEKSVWSRFGSGKRPRIFEHLSRQNSCNESAEIVDEIPGEQQQQQQTKVKSLQKLISKMENTLGMANKANGVA